MNRKHWQMVVFVAAASVFLSATGNADPTEAEMKILQSLWTARKFKPAKEEKFDYALATYKKAWDFEDGSKGRIIGIEGASNIRVEGGKLKFTADKDKVLIKWGDYLADGKSEFKEMIMLPSLVSRCAVNVRGKQSKGATWLVTGRLNGKETGRQQVELKGMDWQDVSASIVMPFDSFGVEIQGPVGNEIEIDSVSIYSTRYSGYYRKTFDLPKGRVWKAVVDILRPGLEAEIYVNGELVYSAKYDSKWWCPWRATIYNPFPLEITQYLKPSQKNVMAIYALRDNYPTHAVVQGTINMEGGERISLNSDETWKAAPEKEEGWFKTDFNDSTWKTAEMDGGFDHGYMAGDRPYYNGFLRIINPYRKKLMYNDSQDIVFQVAVPAVFADKKLPLNCQIQGLGNQLPESLKMTVEKGEVKKDVLLYECKVGKLPRGVYELKAAIGGPDEEKLGLIPRSEEFLVAGAIPQKKVAGVSYEEGMDLELEDTIDCTNPNDPHAFYEAEGEGATKIVEKNGLKYRETGLKDAYFSYALKFKELGRPYLICVDYPDDRDRLIVASVVNLKTNNVPYIKMDNVLVWDAATPGVICGGGGRFPLSGKMRTLKFLYWSRAPEAAINIYNHAFAFESAAAAAKISIYRVKDLPALETAAGQERLFGVGTEWGDFFAQTFRPPMVKEPTHPSWWKGHNPDTAASWYAAGEEFIKYLHFTGQNLVNMGAYMYDNGRYYPDRQVDDSTLEKDFRHLLLAMFDANGISMTAGIEYWYGSYDVNYNASDEDVAKKCLDTVWSISDKGKSWRHCANIFHPEVQSDVLNLVKTLCNKFKDYPSFKGIVFHVFPGIYTPSIGLDYSSPEPLQWGYDDASIRGFEKDTGIKVPPFDNAQDVPSTSDAKQRAVPSGVEGPVAKKDPERFTKRYEYLTKDETRKGKWVDWRCQKMFNIEKEILAQVKKARPDLLLVNNFAFYPAHLKAWQQSGKPIDQFLREMGYDLRLYSDQQDLYFNRWQFQLIAHCGTAQSDTQYLNWLWARDKEVIKLFDREKNRGFAVQMPFDEWNYKGTNPREWPWTLDKVASVTGVIGWPAPAGEHFKEAYTRAFIETDPDFVTFCIFDSNIPVGHEQQLRDFARVFTALPKEKFTTLEGAAFNPNVVVKELRKGDKYYFTVINPGWWQAEAELEVQGLKAGQEIVSLPDGSKLTVKDGKVNVPLAPYEIKAYSMPLKAKIVKASFILAAKSEVDNYFTQRIASFQRLIANPVASDLLDDKELKYFQDCIEKAQGCLKAVDYFGANETVTDWKLNQVANVRLKNIGAVWSWQVIGPFPNDKEGKCFQTAFEVEKDVLAKGAIDKEKEYQGAEKTVKWRKVASQERQGVGFVDFNEIFLPNDWVCAYAFKKIRLPEEQEVILSLGSDDGIKVWINGREVYSNYIARSALPGSDKVKVKLNKGENAILIKVEERIGGWGFFMQVLSLDGQPLSSIMDEVGRSLSYNLPGQDECRQANYGFRLANIAVKEIKFKEQSLFKTRYFYLSGTDSQNRMYYPIFSAGDFPDIKMEIKREQDDLSGRWQGIVTTPNGTALVKVNAELEAKSLEFKLSYDFEAVEDINPGAGNAPFMLLNLTSDSELIWQGKLIVENADGTLINIDLAQFSGKPEMLANIKSLTFQTREGPIKLTGFSNDKPVMFGLRFNNRELESEKKALHIFDIAFALPYPQTKILKGYKDNLRLLFVFPS